MKKIKNKILSVLDSYKECMISLANNYYQHQAIMDYYVFGCSLEEVVDNIFYELTEDNVNAITAFLQYYPENGVNIDPSYLAKIKGIFAIIILTIFYPEIVIKPFKI